MREISMTVLCQRIRTRIGPRLTHTLDRAHESIAAPLTHSFPRRRMKIGLAFLGLLSIFGTAYCVVVEQPLMVVNRLIRRLKTRAS
jgi:hypothetical protein